MITSNKYPLFEQAPYPDVKDPCLVFDGTQWHIFGSGGSSRTEVWCMLHATAYRLEGPWTIQTPVYFNLSGSGVAAPGVIFDQGLFHLFIQTEFRFASGTIEYFTSADGFEWQHEHCALEATANSPEAGIYDPHPALLGGRRYLVYSGFPEPNGFPQAELFLAVSESNSWNGPWRRCGCILDHAAVAAHHNQTSHDDYEWGIEGAQLLQLPNGKVILNATCFLSEGARGQRQRVFFAMADHPEGPYVSLGPILTPSQAGENGHASAVLVEDALVVCYQQRWFRRFWRYGIAKLDWQAMTQPQQVFSQAA